MSGLSVDILIVTWNRKNDLIRTLASIQSQSLQPGRVIVVDNGSEDGTREIIPTEFPEIEFLGQDSNLGACGGRNIGMRSVRGELVFFMDDDTELLPGCLEEIVKRFEGDPGLGAVQPTILLPHQDIEVEVDSSLKPNPHPISAAWCVRASALPRVPWPEHFSRQGEEMWVAMHLYKRGYESEIWPPAKCLHHQAPGGQREKIFFFFTRNSFLLYYQRFPLLLALAMVPYKLLRTLINVRSLKELQSWINGFASGLKMILSGKAKRDSIGWGGAIRYLQAVRSSRDAERVTSRAPDPI
ncbi:MAG: glycosyltransferase family 2 protein [Candidatus Omnitrophica bacterium]|nr:glycosyltransferase family 2 protein [Candidatus Omnitrophota bacterium]